MERGKRININPVDEWMAIGYSLEDAKVLAKLSEIEDHPQIVPYETLKAALDKVSRDSKELIQDTGEMKEVYETIHKRVHDLNDDYEI